MTTAILLVLLGALSRLLPHPPNFVPLGALALFAGATLPRRWAVAVPLAAMAVSDFFLDFGSGRRVLSVGRLAIYGTFAALGLLGRFAREASPAGLAGLSVAASTLFFLTSNLAVWAAGSLYPLTPAGLAACYAAAVPFFWNTLAADLLGTAVFFGIHAVSRRQTRQRVVRASVVFVSALLPPTSAIAQTPPPQAETVVVTATLSPEDERELGSATTVITRERIQASGATTVLEVLRSVPGVDVARQGSDGSLTSLFLRGTNSTHALVLVDGARVNSPYFPGYDFGALTTENVERIEIVRGPFSALYGSDAVGGVIQIFTRPATGGASARVTLEAGDAGQRQGSAFARAGAGAFGVAGSYRNARSDGDRRNSDWDLETGSLRLEAGFANDLRVALEGAVLESEIGVPGAVGAETPRARYTNREERVTLPVTFRPAIGHEATFVAAHVASRPLSSDADTGFESSTDARTLQLRAGDSWKAGRHELALFSSWERWDVDDVSTFGTALDDDSSTLWGAGVQDSVAFGSGFVATAGLRYDRHSDFGGSWSPRATLAWLAGGGRWKLRASGGRAFRAPTVGELFFPFFGNPELEAERSTSWELGVERYFRGSGRVEISLFWNELRNLIVFDFVASRNANVGRARTRGVEVAWRQPVSDRVDLDAGYTLLDAEDRVLDEDLLRRPRHRAFVAATVRPAPRLSLSPRVVFVGRRRDVDGVTFAPTELPSYVRFDLFARYDAGVLAPYLRLENAGDRRYEEVDGYPAPRRRWAAGLELEF